jgi:hypothetical protein
MLIGIEEPFDRVLHMRARFMTAWRTEEHFARIGEGGDDAAVRGGGPPDMVPHRGVARKNPQPGPWANALWLRHCLSTLVMT